MTKQQLDQQKLLEILELAKKAEQNMKDSSENLGTLIEKLHFKAKLKS
ncbi:hypothetical protein [Aphanothece hegewaldii]|nr:hypothetical protein [Aphanothece hegewaldii]